MKVLQILPRLKPALCGVGDYSIELARDWRSRHGVEVEFLVVDPGWAGGSEVESFAVRKLRQRSSAALKEALATFNGDAVVLQYSGYSYHACGAPLWLVTGLRNVQQPVLTMFHELYASGPVTSRAYWYGCVQKWVARSLARLSAGAVTNRQESVRWLERSVPHLKGAVSYLPVFSNLGETAVPVPPSRRAACLVLFQPPAADSVNGAVFWSAWKKVYEVLKPEKVVAAGRCKALPPDSGIEALGVVDERQAAELLSSARWLMMDYYDGYLGKSGIFAAGAAHGAALILASPNHSERDGLEEGKHFTVAAGASGLMDTLRLDAKASELWQWYQTHSIRTTAEVFAKKLHWMIA